MKNINTNKNKISIILCCYNSEPFLKETLDSVKKQSFKDWELIIINDGSLDNTEKIILDFKLLNKELSITYFKQENRGLPFARNKAVELAKYDWIAILDHDDLWVSNKLEIQNHEIIQNPDCYFFFGNNLYFNNKDNLKKTRFDKLLEIDLYDPRNLNLNKEAGYLNLIKHGCFITSSTVVFKKSIYQFVGGFNESYKFLSDYIFFNEIAEKNNLYCSKETLTSFRLSNNQATNKLHSTYVREMIRFYKTIYKSKMININIKLILLKRHIKLLIKYHFKNIFF